MSHIKPRTRRPVASASVVLTILACCLGLAACGGSSSSKTTSTSATSAASVSGGSGAGGTRGRLSGLRECLAKNGITLPKRTPGQRPPGGPGGGFFGGGAGSRLPNGVTPAQMQAALKKCGAGSVPGLRRIDTPAYKQAFTKFAACMREHGVNVPAPNTSGNGPVFSTRGLNVNSATFRSAQEKCRADLAGVLGPPRGASGAPGGPSPGATG
jgi:hypothetical protein